jgi:hypothetical protein
MTRLHTGRNHVQNSLPGTLHNASRCFSRSSSRLPTNMSCENFLTATTRRLRRAPEAATSRLKWRTGERRTTSV